MTSPSRRFITLELNLSADHPELLRGLEVWLTLGLISESQVKQIARSRLVCPYQPAIAPPPIAAPPTSLPRPQPALPSSHPPQPVHLSLMSQLLSSFMAEISVVWLLFLGVFLVVVSSAVLAASQWQNVPPVGQYGILWVYTIAFGWVSGLTGQRANLRLTSRMLQVATLLIIPVNFWMMDGFRLWQAPLGWPIATMAGITLLGLQWQLLRQSSRWQWLNNLLLSLLQWGWMVPGVPLLACYIGTIGTVVLQLSDPALRSPSRSDLSPETPVPPVPVDLGQVAIAFATLLLVGRAIGGQGIPLSALGLALGICGWLLWWQNRRLSRPLWSQIGAGLLALGWLVTVAERHPWQALGISGLTWQLLWHRLHRRWDLASLLGLIAIGIQSYTLLPRLLPESWWTASLQQLTAWANLQSGSWELLGLGLFPSLLGLLSLAAHLNRRQQPHLAATTDAIALGWGLLLVLPGLANPWARASYFLLATLLLGMVLRRRSGVPPGLIYLTHGAGLLAGVAWLNWGWPDLSNWHWAIVCLGLAAGEWLVCLIQPQPVWARSAWYLGLGLAGLSQISLAQALVTGVPAGYGLLALGIPFLLTVLARSPAFSRVTQPAIASWLSVVATLLALGFAWGELNPWLLAVSIATGLLLINTEWLRHPIAAGCTVGSGLVWLTTIGWRIWNPIPADWMLLWIAGLICWLWLIWSRFRRPETDPLTADSRPALAPLYATMADGWAISLTGVSLLLLTGSATVEFFLSPAWALLQNTLATALVTGAIVVRMRGQPTAAAVLGLAWGLELMIAYLAELGQFPLVFRAMANLGLALISQWAGDGWLRSRWQSPPRQVLHGVPLLYAMLGIILGHSRFTHFTGLYTVAAALPVLGVGRRQPGLKSLTYLGLITASIGAYELLIYQVTHAPHGGQLGDVITLFAALTTALAIGYWGLSRWLERWLHLEPEELAGMVLGHWAIASLLLFLAWMTPLSGAIEALWIGVATMLGSYALWLGRRQSLWIYPGLVELWVAIAALLHELWPAVLDLAWVGAIAVVIAFVTDVLPWRRWGWEVQPVRQASALMPALVILITLVSVNIQSLLLAGTFYAWLARINQQIRLSYVSLGLGGWAMVRLLPLWGLRDPLWLVAIVSGALLFVVQVDPDLQPADKKEVRHWLRCLATGLFCLTALYQSELVLLDSLDRWWQGLLTIGFSLGLIGAGLTWRTRAFLYIGTLTFILKVLRQLWLFIADYSLSLWALGIALGLVLIWVAATFEARRSQAIALLQYWLTELESWE